MTKNLPADAIAEVAPPDDMGTLFASAGLTVTLVVTRTDGQPLTDADREVLPVLVDGYALGRELNPTDEEMSAVAAQMARERNPTDEELTRAVTQTLKATGTGGE